MIQPKLIFEAPGTLGDQLPLLALAKSLLALGHRCHMLGTTAAVDIAARWGVPFTVVAPANANNLASVEENFSRYVFPSYRPTFEFFEAEAKRGSPLVVVNLSGASASTLMAERHGLPLCRLLLSPFELAPHARSWSSAIGLDGILWRTLRRFVQPAAHPSQHTHPYILRRVNRFRAALRRPALQDMAELDALVAHRIGLFPEWYGAAVATFRSRVDLVGFPLPPPECTLPDPLCRWIERHGPPLVFTPGTGVRDVAAFFAAAEACCRELGRPLVLLSPNAEKRPFDMARAVVHFDYLDLGLLLPRSCLIVHHGGIGTTARALEAGVPQIISPLIFDQPDNARRVEQLGVGLALSRGDFCGEALALRARRLLDSASVQSATARARRLIRRGDGATTAAASLVRRFVTTPRRGRRLLDQWVQPGRLALSLVERCTSMLSSRARGA
jgi:rhamnosyltransferase subunit B